MPGKPAARLGDMHTCPMVDPGPKPHVGGPVLPACMATVLIGGMPAARVSDKLTCMGPPDTIVKGSANVLIGGRPAARMGDSTAHGGVIVAGCPTVLIGEDGGGGGVAADRARIAALSNESLAADKAAEDAARKCDTKTEAEKKAVSAAKLDEARTILRPYLPDRNDPNANWGAIIERLDVSSPPDKAVFWSGDSISAKAFADIIGGVTLETTPGGHVIDGWDEINPPPPPKGQGYEWNGAAGSPPPHARGAWMGVSENYATGASGKVHVVQTPAKQADPKTVWAEKEKDILLERRAKGEVSSLDMYVADSGKVVAVSPHIASKLLS